MAVISSVCTSLMVTDCKPGLIQFRVCLRYDGVGIRWSTYTGIWRLLTAYMDTFSTKTINFIAQKVRRHFLQQSASRDITWIQGARAAHSWSTQQLPSWMDRLISSGTAIPWEKKGLFWGLFTETKSGIHLSSVLRAQSQFSKLWPSESLSETGSLKLWAPDESWEKCSLHNVISPLMRNSWNGERWNQALSH